MDWARNYWDFRTDAGATKPGSMEVLDVYEDAFIWNTSGTSCASPGPGGSHYKGILESVDDVLGSVLEGRFDSRATFNGSNW